MDRFWMCFLAFGLTTGLAASVASAEEPLEGPWQVTWSGVSTTCGGDPDPPSVVDVEIQQSGSYLVLLPEDPIDGLTDWLGTVSGQSLSLGFELFAGSGIKTYDSVSNDLTIAQDLESFSGDVPWKFYTRVNCSGLENWGFIRAGEATEPNSLTGSWEVAVAYINDNCGDGPRPTRFFDMDAVQFGDGAVRFVPPALPGLREVAGTVTGQSLALGLEVFGEGGVTVYDPNFSDLTIAEDFNSFSANLDWHFFLPRQCSGVDHIEAVFVPEPAAGWLGVAMLSTLAGCARRRRTAA
jgi:hypothetical protein